MSWRLDHFPLQNFPRLTHFGRALSYKNEVLPGREGLHRHFGYEFKFITEGRFSFSLHPDLAPVTLGPGDLLVTSPAFAHRFHTSGVPVTYWWFGLQTGPRVARAPESHYSDYHPGEALEVSYEEQVDSDLEALERNLRVGRYLIVHRFWEAERLFEELERELIAGPARDGVKTGGRQGCPGASRRYVRELIHLKLLELFTRMLRRIEEQPGREGASARIQRARDHLEARLDQPLRLQGLARVAGMSSAHFSRAFRRTYGEPPVALANRLRLERAKRLLAAGESVATVATACGFKDPFYFSAFFKTRLGVSPSGYKAKGTLKNQRQDEKRARAV